MRIVFCEGRPGSLDDLLLGHILPIGRTLIRPVGGKTGFKAFIQGHLESYGDALPEYVGFRDRDFDEEPLDTPQLVPWGKDKRLWLTHRTTVENYLISPVLIWQYWKEREKTPEWRHGLALTIEEIALCIQDSARQLAEYQAVRWALASLKPGDYWPAIATTWIKDGYALPGVLAYKECLEQACHLVDAYRGQSMRIDQSHLQASAEKYRERFAEESFFETHEYLVWFHGKDLLAHVCGCLSPSFPRKHYADWAAEHVDVNEYPDLQQLIAIVSGS